GVPTVVGVNRYTADTDAEVDIVNEYCETFGVHAVNCTHWADGGAGATELAERVAELADSGAAQFRTLYSDELSLWEKTKRVATHIYGADDIIADKKVREQFAQFEKEGYGKYPVCIAKTQYSFSTDPNLLGAPSGHVVPIREVRLAAGAEFVVVVCGAIMTMPGLPRAPAANNISVNKDGQIEGLF
ncbi:MAG: formate--tetrahydrofolate ligase, partial [Gammaproteobacteria bacterium]|nr:formate--tetrahydrofolate ligase [Gammaproteobacteria bacterium]